jgi:hypothetical protein
MNITTATPVEIDTKLEALLLAEDKANQHLGFARQNLVSVAQGYDYQAKFTHAEALAAVQALAAGDTYRRTDAVKALARLTEALAIRDAISAEIRPLTAEFERRGGWTRAFLVLASNGHVHRDRACSTCFPSTSYGWLPQVSGFNEDEIVAAAGEGACTVCYPSAPVDVLKRTRTLLHSSEVEAQAARDERAAAKLERDAKKAAKAISNPDGTPLQVFTYHAPERILRDRKGLRVIRTIPAHDVFDTIETLAAAKTWLTDQLCYGYEDKRGNQQRVAEAIAYKLDTDPGVEIANAAARARKRR